MIGLVGLRWSDLFLPIFASEDLDLSSHSMCSCHGFGSKFLLHLKGGQQPRPGLSWILNCKWTRAGYRWAQPKPDPLTIQSIPHVFLKLKSKSKSKSCWLGFHCFSLVLLRFHGLSGLLPSHHWPSCPSQGPLALLKAKNNRRKMTLLRKDGC